MLISSKNILNAPLPLLLQLNSHNWKLITDINQDKGKLNLCVLNKVNTKISKKIIIMDEVPFHVGDNVWELKYGSLLMTFNKNMKQNHPAYQLWNDWLSNKANIIDGHI